MNPYGDGLSKDVLQRFSDMENRRSNLRINYDEWRNIALNSGIITTGVGILEIGAEGAKYYPIIFLDYSNIGENPYIALQTLPSHFESYILPSNEGNMVFISNIRGDPISVLDNDAHFGLVIGGAVESDIIEVADHFDVHTVLPETIGKYRNPLKDMKFVVTQYPLEESTKFSVKDGPDGRLNLYTD
jgi:hypothetical protein